MTQRLSLFVSVSLLAHLALLAAWYVSPSTVLVTPHTLRVALVHHSQQASSAGATQLPAPAKAPVQQHMTSPHHVQRQSRTVKAVPTTPVMATPAAMTTFATATPVIQKVVGLNCTAATVAYVQGQVRLAFARYFNYPALARRHGWEGVVKLGLRLDPDGQLRAVHLIQSSGYSALDAAALASAQRIPPLREVVTRLQGNAHEIQLPVEYRLIDG